MVIFHGYVKKPEDTMDPNLIHDPHLPHGDHLGGGFLVPCHRLQQSLGLQGQQGTTLAASKQIWGAPIKQGYGCEKHPPMSAN